MDSSPTESLDIIECVLSSETYFDLPHYVKRFKREFLNFFFNFWNGNRLKQFSSDSENDKQQETFYLTMEYDEICANTGELVTIVCEVFSPGKLFLSNIPIFLF